MKKSVCFIAVMMLFCFTATAFAQSSFTVVTVQSKKLKPYQEALKGFRTRCDARVKNLYLADSSYEKVLEKIQRIQPDMVLAVGNEALTAVKSINRIPVVYLMVLNPEKVLDNQKNITGVSMNISPKQQLSTLLTTLPDKKKIGVIYDPSRTGAFIKKAVTAAGSLKADLVLREVRNPTDVPSALMDLKGNIDVLWMIPDITVVNKMSVEFMMLYCLEHSIPVVSFSEKYVHSGAVVSIGIDAFDIGRQAGEMALAVLSEGAGRPQVAHARTAVISVNAQIARKAAVSINKHVAQNLGVRIDQATMGRARIVD